MEPDFSGYATKANVRCADGRVIKPSAFAHMNGAKVPLVWQHGHGEATNVLGHAVLETRTDGVYCKGYLNDTPGANHTRLMLQHGDIERLSIYANQLREAGKDVVHGQIREVSLVISGANPGAKIDFVRIAHGEDDIETLDDEAIIHSGEKIDHIAELEEGDEELEHASIKEVYDSMSDDQKTVLHFMVAKALENPGAEHSDIDQNDEGAIEHKEGSPVVHRNVFDRTDDNKPKADERHELSHDDLKGIMAAAKRPGATLKTAVEDYALAHGITNLDMLFPDAKTLQDRPEFKQRRVEWVTSVMSSTSHSPFSRVKTVTADITQDSARALGYIKGSYKKEEWFGLTKRVTTPTTIYKKQKLDRDDVIDVADFDVVAWMKAEMRLMIQEELASAILFGDGRDPSDPDKIKDPGAAVSEGAGIRSILNDHELFQTTIQVNISDSSSSYNEITDAVIRARRFYKGTGRPTFYTTAQVVSEFMLLRDEAASNRRLYATKADLAAALMVDDIVEVETMDRISGLIGIMVNLSDYNIGTDRGGELTMFDDFDIDYNQLKYLIETRLSGALTKIKSAIIIKTTTTANVVAPQAPTFNKTTGVITIPSQTGVVYRYTPGGSNLTAGAQTAISAGTSQAVYALPASTYYFETNENDEWLFTRPA